VLVAPLTPFIQNPILLFSCALVLVLATMSYGAYRLGLRLLGDRALAILAAIAIPYSGQQTGHYYHINGSTGFGFPLLMLGLLRLQEEPSLAAALLTGLAFGLQAGTSGYSRRLGRGPDRRSYSLAATQPLARQDAGAAARGARPWRGDHLSVGVGFHGRCRDQPGS